MKRRAWLAALAAVAIAGCASMEQPKNIAEIAASDPNFSTLSKLLNDAGLADTLKGTGPFTVFAPTNDAFKAVPQKTMAELAGNKDRLRSVLTYHVVPGSVSSDAVKPGNIKTVQGANLAVAKAGAFVTVENAVVTRPDIKATNGVIHVIDAVLIPPAR